MPQQRNLESPYLQLMMRLSHYCPIFSHSKMYIELRLCPSVEFRPINTHHASNRSNRLRFKHPKPTSQLFGIALLRPLHYFEAFQSPLGSLVQHAFLN